MSSPSPPYRGRFAPSPTGRLHFGSLIAALGSWLRARAAGGTWLVRIEDIDPPREVPGAADDILATLAAFGLDPDEPVLWQHARTDAYDAALASLRENDLAFACWCSRADLAAHGGLHHGACVAAPDASRAPAWRVRAPAQVVAFRDALAGDYAQHLANEAGDFVVRRVEGFYAYQLAVVVDDAYQGITEVVRGADLLDSTPRQIWLQRALGVPTPAYLHLPLALGPDGRKLSKTDSARPVDGDDPLPALRAALAFLGLPAPLLAAASSPPRLLRTAVDRFDLANVPRPVLPVSESGR
ncbi:tRNA glutamyl-Q(34) synthetase GluQRS [Tahibacter soli]|uniref:Glutamyl-Q tRNA(Asp) synthetase n=1 Tax=Tahibacter soli TaxID=2983605 RepID=A0A9X3YPN1_9GAMM|nr:tRNA glutamyl-Q(34) synthetase GluQRS [Tahibacter soli]MDC8015170.1 tRNA glutamyl-Q(34) synthetase GluQRS [Tahibacter soli]